MRGLMFHHHGSGRHQGANHSHRDTFGGRDGLSGRGIFGGRSGSRGGRESRGFGHGGLRLVVLKLISEKPRHGYELIKEIEERFKGNYSPSPGVIYPTLAWLEDEGFITVSAGEDGRKSACVTETGLAHLSEKAGETDRLLELMDAERGDDSQLAPLVRAMGNLKMALRGRANQPLAKTELETIVDLIDELAKKIERL